MRTRRTAKLERLAKLYDAEILPVFSQRFGQMLLRRLSLEPRAMVLDVGGGTGYPAIPIARQLAEGGRVISIDTAPALLDVAREKAGQLSGRRVFFRSESASPRLSFPDEAFDAVVANLSLHELPQPVTTLAEFARVCRAGGHVVATLPLAGSWAEVLDLLREVLFRRERTDALARLEAYAEGLPDRARLCAWAERAGLTDVEVDEEPFTLLFKSSREFLFAPVVEFGPLPAWRAICGTGEPAAEAIEALGEAIDAYFGGSSFPVTVRAGCLSGRAPATAARLAAVTSSAREGGAAAGDVSVVLETSELELLAESDALDEDAEAEALVRDLDRLAAPRSRRKRR